MPRYTDLSRHCVDCAHFKGCEIRLKVESLELYPLLDPVLESFLECKIEYKLYSFISCCEKFEKSKPSNPTQAVLEKAMSGEMLTEEEQELLSRVMEGLGGD